MGVLADTATIADLESVMRKLTELEGSLRATTVKLASITAERDRLRHAYDLALGQLELLRRRIFQAKAERVDTQQLEIEFAETKAKLVKLTQEFQGSEAQAEDDLATAAGKASGDSSEGDGRPPRTRKSPKGRRDLYAIEMPEERVELLDPALEGTHERIGFEESCQLGYRRGGPVRIVLARATYKVVVEGESAELVTVPKPKQVYERGLLAPSFIAHLLTKKFRWGMPFHRVSLELASEGIDVDDSLMCRYAEHVGATLGAVVLAMAKEARETAFCLSTDATGVAIQPTRLPGGKRQACAKGHFFVVLADKDHIFFEYQPKHTGDAVCAMFRGFSGYIQADAHCIYDALFRGKARVRPEDKPPDEVACWAHARRKFWEAAVTTKDVEAREALLRVRMLFQLEERLRDRAPQQRHAERQRHARPLLDNFFAWAEGVEERVKHVRGPLASAFGYAIRQRDALRRFLDDGRLLIDNNRAERALRTIAVGRNAWFFIGSDDHAEAAANTFSLIASASLHDLDAELYLAELIRVLPYWPRERYLELAPKYWRQTRARLDQAELKLPVGHITVPSPPEQQTSAS